MKKTAFAISLVVFICSIISLGFWVKFTIDAQNNYSEAMKNVDEAKKEVEIVKEEYAEALAKLGNLDDIFARIDAEVARGDYDFDTGVWLKNRIGELRVSYPPSGQVEQAEEKAQIYAGHEDWSLERIFEEIDWAVEQGFIPASDVDWIKNRVIEIRNNSP